MSRLKILSKNPKRLKSLLSKVRIRTWVALAFIGIVGPIVLLALYRPSNTEAWYNTNWLYRKKLTVDNTKVSGSINLTDFPMLVSLSSDTNLSTYAQADGDDILFTDTNGNKLNHEIESYSSGTLVAWVKIPTLFTTTDTSIYMYYGNSSAASQESATSVWDSNYRGVWHLNEAVTDEDTAGSHLDSTTNANNLTQNNNNDIAGKIGTAQDLDGTADYMTINDNASLSPGGTTLTIQAWVYVPTSHVDYACLVGKARASGAHTAPYYEYALNLQTGQGDFFTANGTGGADYVRATDAQNFGLDGWHMMYGIYDGSNITLYIDTVQEGQTANTVVLQDFAGPLRIGANGAPGEYAKARIDEVRVATTNRSTDWMTTEYNNQNSPSTFYVTGTQEQLLPTPVAYWKFDEGVNDTCSGGSNDACDSSSNANDGAFGATTAAPTWKSEDLCVSEKCLYFDGSNDTITVSNTVSNVQTVSFWVKPISTTEQFIDLDGSAYITISNGSLSATGFTSPTYYVDGVTYASPTLVANKWQHVAVTTGTAISASAITIGNQSTNFGNQFMDEVKLFPLALTASQIKVEYTGGSAVLGTSLTEFLSDGLVGYWKLDEVSGNATDSSGSGTTLTNNNTAAFTGAKFGNGTELNGTDEYFEAADNATLSLTGNLTLSAWINPDDVTGSQNIIGKWDGTNNSYLLALEGDELRMYVDSSSNYETTSASNLTATMTHVAGVYNSATTTISLYVNGQLQASATTGTIPSSIGDDAGEIVIGADDSAANYFDGHIDEARIYNRALSPQEITDLYHWAAGPIAYWKIDSGSGSTAFDSSGNGRNMTLRNMEADDWRPGKFGQALYFDGSSEYADFDVTTDNELYPYSATLSVWVNITTAAGGGAAHGLALSEGDPFGMTIEDTTNDVWLYSTTATTNWGWDSGYDAPFNEWVYLTMVYDYTNSTKSLYVNGVFQNSVASSGAPTQGAVNDFEIGRQNFAGADYFNGLLDEVKLYNYVRTPSQIIEDMNVGHPIPGSPIGSESIYWKLDTGHSTTAYDTIGNQNGTITNATWLYDGSCKLSRCLNFDASGEVVTIATASDADVDFKSSEPFSGSAWVYVTTMPGSGEQDAIIAKWDDTNNLADYKLYVENDDADTTGNFEVQIYDESASQAIIASGANDSVAVDTWYHVLFTFNGGVAGAVGDLKLYVDGQYKAQNAVNASFLGLEDKASDFTVGEYDTNDAVATNTAFTGRIDEVKIYATNLTTDQVKIDYNYGSAAAFSTGQRESDDFASGIGNAPLTYWNFNENTGTSAYDAGANANTISWTAGYVGWEPGKFGSAVKCDGTNVATFAEAADVNFETTGTMQLWFKVNAPVVDTDMIIERFAGGDPGSGYHISIDGDTSTLDATHRAGIAGGPATQTISLDGVTNVVDNKWHLATWIIDTANTISKTYIDGVYENYDATFDTLIEGVATPNFCGQSTGNYNFSGLVDQFTKFDYIRTPSQIAHDYNRGAPRVWYKFDDCTGTTAYNAAQNGNGDAYGNNATLTIGAGGGNSAAGTCSTSGAWYDGASGKHNYSIELDGNDDFLTTSALSPLAYASRTISNFSWGGWYYPTTSAASKTLMEKATEFHLTTDADSKPVCGVYYSAAFNDATAGSTALTLNAWNHVLCVYNGGTIKTYLNGREVGSTVETTLVTAASSILYLGESSAADQRFEGKLDDNKIWFYDLSATQVLNDYNQTANTFGPSTGHPQ